MTGEPGRNKRCPICGGHLRNGTATLPFLFANKVVLVKDVPAEICDSCHEPFAIGGVTDRLVALVSQLRRARAELSIASFSEAAVPIGVESA